MKILYGSQNFGYEIKESDKDWLSFVYPTWEDIVNNTMKSVEHQNEDGSVTKIKDIRLIIKMIEKCNFNDLQILYAQEYYHCADLSWFIEYRDVLVKHNLRQLYYSNRGYAISCLKKGTQKDLIRSIAFKNMIERAYSEEEFEMRDPSLAELRQKEKLDPQMVNKIVFESFDKYELIADNQFVNIGLLGEAKKEVERLLKKNLL